MDKATQTSKRQVKRPVIGRNVGDVMIERLTEFRDALMAGEDIAKRVRVTTRGADVPEPKAYGRADVAGLRGRLNVSQAVFARVVGVSAVLARQWESGVRKPSPVACRLFEFIEREPTLVGPWIDRPAGGRPSQS